MPLAMALPTMSRGADSSDIVASSSQSDALRPSPRNQSGANFPLHHHLGIDAHTAGSGNERVRDSTVGPNSHNNATHTAAAIAISASPSSSPLRPSLPASPPARTTAPGRVHQHFPANNGAVTTTTTTTATEPLTNTTFPPLERSRARVVAALTALGGLDANAAALARHSDTAATFRSRLAHCTRQQLEDFAVHVWAELYAVSPPPSAAAALLDAPPATSATPHQPLAPQPSNGVQPPSCETQTSASSNPQLRKGRDKFVEVLSPNHNAAGARQPPRVSSHRAIPTPTGTDGTDSRPDSGGGVGFLGPSPPPPALAVDASIVSFPSVTLPPPQGDQAASPTGAMLMLPFKHGHGPNPNVHAAYHHYLRPGDLALPVVASLNDTMGSQHANNNNNHGGANTDGADTVELNDSVSSLRVKGIGFSVGLVNDRFRDMAGFDIVNGYVFLQIVGAGTVGTVWVVEDDRGEKFAIKVVRKGRPRLLGMDSPVVELGETAASFHSKNHGHPPSTISRHPSQRSINALPQQHPQHQTTSSALTLMMPRLLPVVPSQGSLADGDGDNGGDGGAATTGTVSARPDVGGGELKDQNDGAHATMMDTTASPTGVRLAGGGGLNGRTASTAGVNRGAGRGEATTTAASPDSVMMKDLHVLDDISDALRREIAIMKKLSHRNIVPLYEVIDDRDNRQLMLRMKYIPHGPIITLLRDGSCGKIDENTAAGYLRQIAAGLHHLHSKNIVHRDIKPSNLLLERSELGDTVYITDFGVSEFARAGCFGGQRGTPAFFSPELLSNADVDSGMAVDMWALGVTYYCMVVGQHPFFSFDPCEMERNILSGRVVFPPSAHGLSSESRTAIQRLLAVDPRERMTVQQLRQSGLLLRTKMRLERVLRAMTTTDEPNGPPMLLNSTSTTALAESLKSPLARPARATVVDTDNVVDATRGHEGCGADEDHDGDGDVVSAADLEDAVTTVVHREHRAVPPTSTSARETDLSDSALTAT